MALRLSDRWVWDFWHVADGPDHHLFYLQAPRSLGDPELRHWNVSIGHAVSDDLVSWSVLPDALEPGAPGTWDDYTTWTGSITRHAGRWCMLYTGTSRAEKGLVQRIGLALSDDLVRWERHGGALIEADPRWYELLDLTTWHDQAWRDPWIVPRADGSFDALVTARAATGDPAIRGVVGRARSRDLVEWAVLPPLTEPFGFGQMEVPQLVVGEGRSYLLFCGDAAPGTDGHVTGTFALSGDDPAGPFPASSLAVLAADPRGSSYAGKIVESGRGPQFMAWERAAADGGFAGTISDPVPVWVGPRGLELSADASGASPLEAAS